MSDWTPGPWQNYRAGYITDAEGLLVATADPGPDIYANARLIALAPELAESLEAILGWLEGTDEIVTNHGAHSDAVWARKLLDRLKGEE